MENKTYTLLDGYNHLENFLNEHHKELFNEPTDLLAAFEVILDYRKGVYKLYGTPRVKKRKSVMILELDSHGYLEREVYITSSKEFTESLKDAEKRKDEKLKLIYGTTK